METCPSCGEQANSLYECHDCKQGHCVECRLPESHDCEPVAAAPTESGEKSGFRWYHHTIAIVLGASTAFRNTAGSDLNLIAGLVGGFIGAYALVYLGLIGYQKLNGNPEPN